MWVPLHVHSQYSILDGTASCEALVLRAKEFGMEAVALTDHGNLHGAIDFYKLCGANKIRPIIGCDLAVAPGSRLEKSRGKNGSLVLLAKNGAGYRSLCQLSTRAHLEGFYYVPRIDLELLEQYREGLICLSGSFGCEVMQLALAENLEPLKERLQFYQGLFGDDYFVELQRHRMRDEELASDGMMEEEWLFEKYRLYVAQQEKANEVLVRLARELGIGIVATNDSHYLDRDDWKAHEVLLNVQSGEACEVWERDSLGRPKQRNPNPKRSVYASHELYFKSPEQMAELFRDLPEALSNSVEIARRCDLQLDLKARHYPVFVPPQLPAGSSEAQRSEAAQQFLRQLCDEALPRRYSLDKLKRLPGDNPMQAVRDRLAFELDIILSKGLGDYILLVWDFIHWAKQQQIPVGPGRGSGVGSVVLYLIGVTDIEPMGLQLFFERFINPERLSYPDIDVDICMEQRGRVIEYLVQKHGRENVAQIVTFGTMKAKMALRDVGRVLSVPLPKVNALAKLIPDDLDMTLGKALEMDPDLHRLYMEDQEVRRLIDTARKLEGSIRNSGVHAAGLIIGGSELVHHLPLCRAKDSAMPVTQYAMKPVEAIGMLKMDLLGLKTLTSIQKAFQALAQAGTVLDWTSLPLDDRPTYQLLCQGKTLGVFQMESGGFQELSRQLQPDRFEEIVAILSLYRPGPMEMIPSFIARKHGREPIENDHPMMKDILAETYGIMVYQEQVMQIASSLAGYSLGEGDVLRRAMGKKDRDEMARQRKQFLQGAMERGLTEENAAAIFDKMEKFAAYGFNKSHSAGYAYLTYVTAYLKANHPAIWMASLLTCDSGDLTKVAKLISECHAMGISVLPPDLNESGSTFVATQQGIRFALSAIKGVGEGVVELIVAERTQQGPFKSLFDFLSRVDARQVGKKTVELLVDAGCFDFTGWSRDLLRASVEPFYEVAHRRRSDSQAGILSLFSLMPGGDCADPEPPSQVPQSSRLQQLLRERDLLGFFLTGNPLQDYGPLLQKLGYVPLNRLEAGSVHLTAFVVQDVEMRFAAKTQRKFALLRIGDGGESLELPIWGEMCEAQGSLLEENRLLLGVIQIQELDDRRNCLWLGDLATATADLAPTIQAVIDRARSPSKRPRRPHSQSEKAPTGPLRLQMELSATRLSSILALKTLLRAAPGRTPVQIDFVHAGRPVSRLSISESWGVQPTPGWLNQIRSVAGLTVQ
jgi:DNA polymerase III subunit alpha